MRLPIASLILALAAVGCGGTTFYDIDGQPPQKSLAGKTVVVKPFEAGAVSGMTNEQASGTATDAFTNAIFGKAGIKIVNLTDLKAIMKQRGLAEMDVESMDDSKMASLAHADAVVSGRVVTAREDGRSGSPTSSEVEISVRATDLRGIMFFKASQRAVSTQKRLFPVIHIGRSPAQPANDLLKVICQNLAELLVAADG